jgi:hypothetical protein
VFLALYLDGVIKWPLAWVLSPIVLHAAIELLLLMMSFPMAPSTPADVKVVCADGNATVTWTHAPAVSCLPVRFIVDLKPDRSDIWLRKHVGRDCTFTATNLPPSRTFVLRVIAQDPSGATSSAVMSQPFIILHRMPPKPEPPRALKFIRQIRRNKSDSRDISVSLLAVVAWLKAEEGASYTLEAATLLSDENSWRVIYTGPVLETRVPNIPPATAFKMRLTVSVAAAPRQACITSRHSRQVRTDFGTSPPSELSFFTTPRCGAARHEVALFRDALLQRRRYHECQRFQRLRR